MGTGLREAVTAQLMRVEDQDGARPPEAPPAPLPYMEAHKLDPGDRRGRDGRSHVDGAADAGAARHHCRCGNRRPGQSVKLGQGRAHDACPCGSGKEVQATATGGFLIRSGLGS